MPDAMFNDQRLADIYDDLDADRSDLDVYASMVAELGAASVLDVGCDTGCFAVQLAERGIANATNQGGSLVFETRDPSRQAFRERHQIEESLERVGYLVREIRDAPDRPGKEFVFVAELIAP